MARYIYIDAETGSWGGADTLYIVDMDALSENDIEDLLNGTDSMRADIAEETASQGFGVLLDAEIVVRDRIRH